MRDEHGNDKKAISAFEGEMTKLLSKLVSVSVEVAEPDSEVMWNVIDTIFEHAYLDLWGPDDQGHDDFWLDVKVVGEGGDFGISGRMPLSTDLVGFCKDQLSDEQMEIFVRRLRDTLEHHE